MNASRHATLRQFIPCGQVWGGIHADDATIETSGVRASLFCRPSKNNQGGDIYFFSVCDEDQLMRIALVDVAGHGKPVTETSQSLYEQLTRHINSVEGNQILSHLNDDAGKIGSSAFSTAVVVTSYLSTERLWCSYAGHHPVLLRNRETGKWTSANVDNGKQQVNLPLGTLPGSLYSQSEFPVRPGDCLFMYTDGLLEAPGKDGNQFGINRINSVLTESADDPAETIKANMFSELESWTGGNLDHDDVTFMAVELG